MAAGSSPKPIQDAGWSWVIAAACCWVTFVIQGLVRSSGVIYVALIDTFEVTRGQASWPFTLRMAIWNLSGPVAGALSYKWSIRTITLIGILIVTAGYVVCWIASDITIVTIFLGVVQGFGVGISVTLIPVIINQYFSKYKSTGAGIACAGSTFGSFALSPIVELTIEEYGLSGSFLMMGGMTLHGILGAALMRPAEWLESTQKGLPQKHPKIKQHDDSSHRHAQMCPESKPFLRKEDSVNLTVFCYPQNTEGDVETTKPNPTDTHQLTPDNSILTNCTKNDHIPPLHDALQSRQEEAVTESSTLLSLPDEIPKVFNSKVPTIPPNEIYLNANHSHNEMDSLYHQAEEDVLIKGGRLQFTNEDSNYNPQINIAPLQRQHTSDDVKGSLIKQKACDHESSVSNDIRHRYGKYSPIGNIIPRNDTITLERCSSKWRSKLGGLLEPVKAASSILANPMFLLVALSYSVFFLSYMTYLIVIVDYALDLGISRTDSVFLVSTFSIADLCGRLGSGWITDSGFVKRKNLLMINMTIVGSLLIATSFSHTYMALMGVSVTTGLVVGVNLIIFYGLLEEYLGLQKMAMAVGLMNFCIGCLSLVTPFLTGVFRDTLGTYIYLFQFLGAISMFCGLLWALESVMTACRKSKSLQVEADSQQDLN